MIEVDFSRIELNLDGCFEKLARAEEHFHSFNGELGRFLDSDPYGALGKVEGEDGWYVFRVQVRREPPMRLGVILGEYVHQLRSTLDHLMWQIACWHLKPKMPSRAAFPINTKASDIKAATQRLTSRVPCDWLKLVQRLQPHGRHDDPLAILERLWNSDKHYTVVPVPVTETLTLGHAQHRTNTDAGPVHQWRPRAGVRLEDGAELARARIRPQGPNPRVDMYVLSAVRIQAFGVGPLGMLPITWKLQQAESLIRGLLGLFPGGRSDVQSIGGAWNTYATAITSLDNEAAAREFGFFIPGRHGTA